jgi:hypothetical protein
MNIHKYQMRARAAANRTHWKRAESLMHTVNDVHLDMWLGFTPINPVARIIKLVELRKSRIAAGDYFTVTKINAAILKEARKTKAN